MGYHINSGNSKAGISGPIDHIQISEEAFLHLRNFTKVAKVVKIAGKTLLVASIVLDALELGTAISTDLSDADGKLGKTALAEVASIGGRWTGGIAGAKIGAAAGAAIGGFIPIPVVGPVIGAAVVGLTLGIVGAMAGETAGEWIVDLPYAGE